MFGIFPAPQYFGFVLLSLSGIIFIPVFYRCVRVMSGLTWCTLPVMDGLTQFVQGNFRVRIVQHVLRCTECSGQEIINCQDAEEYSVSFCRKEWAMQVA